MKKQTFIMFAVILLLLAPLVWHHYNTTYKIFRIVRYSDTPLMRETYNTLTENCSTFECKFHSIKSYIDSMFYTVENPNLDPDVAIQRQDGLCGAFANVGINLFKYTNAQIYLVRQTYTHSGIVENHYCLLIWEESLHGFIRCFNNESITWAIRIWWADGL